MQIHSLKANGSIIRINYLLTVTIFTPDNDASQNADPPLHETQTTGHGTTISTQVPPTHLRITSGVV